MCAGAGLGGDLEDLPAVLTVEEAARLLRIGRSLAYQLAGRFLDGEREALPVIRLGGCLRVPRWALVELIRNGRVVSDVNAVVSAAIDAQLDPPAAARRDPEPDPPTDAPPDATPARSHRTQPRTSVSGAQLTLLDAG